MKILTKIKDTVTSRDKGTIIRTVLHWLSIANEIVAIIGQTSFAAAEWYQWMSLGLVILFTALTWWYNEDFTKLAKMGSKVLDALKDGKITLDEVQHFLDDADKASVEEKDGNN